LLGPISTFKRPDETVIDEANSEDSPAQQTTNSGGED
jgi:hypothetical protein